MNANDAYTLACRRAHELQQEAERKLAEQPLDSGDRCRVDEILRAVQDIINRTGADCVPVALDRNDRIEQVVFALRAAGYRVGIEERTVVEKGWLQGSEFSVPRIQAYYIINCQALPYPPPGTIVATKFPPVAAKVPPSHPDEPDYLPASPPL